MQLNNIVNEQTVHNIKDTITHMLPFEDTTYKSSGVVISPKKIKTNSDITIEYTGELAKKGASSIYMHCGNSLGNHQWINTQEIRMKKNNQGTFEATVPIKYGTYFNVCFHDNWNNWDNNYRENYSFQIH